MINKDSKALFTRNLLIKELHHQGYFNTEIAKMLKEQFSFTFVSRERIRQILKKSKSMLGDDEFRAIRVRRRYPQVLIECACGCRELLPKYRYYRNYVGIRKYLYGHAPIRNPEGHARKISETKKREWAEGVYSHRRPSTRELANRKKFIAFVAKHPGCTPYRVAQETGMEHATAIFHARKLCDISKGKLPAKYILQLKEEVLYEGGGTR